MFQKNLKQNLKLILKNKINKITSLNYNNETNKKATD